MTRPLIVMSLSVSKCTNEFVVFLNAFTRTARVEVTHIATLFTEDVNFVGRPVKNLELLFAANALQIRNAIGLVHLSDTDDMIFKSDVHERNNLRREFEQLRSEALCPA